MKLTKSRLHKIMNCKVQTRKKRNKPVLKSDSSQVDTNTGTKRRHNRYFNLRNNTVKNWSAK